MKYISIESIKSAKITKSINSNILSSQNQSQTDLYDELMNLEEKNNLNSQISFVKNQQKKINIFQK